MLLRRPMTFRSGVIQKRNNQLSPDTGKVPNLVLVPAGSTGSADGIIDQSRKPTACALSGSSSLLARIWRSAQLRFHKRLITARNADPDMRQNNSKIR